MKIGFDLDGVLCDTDMNFLRLLTNVPPYDKDIEMRKELETWYFNERKPLLNPEHFMSEDDEYYVITGREDEVAGEVTKNWCGKFAPNAKGVYCVGKHLESVEEDKAKKIVELGLDIFIDDHPVTVKTLREILPEHIKVIQYGGRWIR
jgi:hypothetical protein